MNRMKWIPTTERLPEESGSYLVTDSFGDVLFLNYSKKYNLWNVNDWNTERKAKKTGWGWCRQLYCGMDAVSGTVCR